jgi:LEA14-like dessication related protein
VEPAEIDFGEVVQQRVLEAKVKLVNAENKSEVILSVTADCGCTTASVLKEVLAPGESTTLTIKVETRVQSGNVRRTVIVHANSGDLSVPVKFSVSPAPASSSPGQLR